VKIRDRSKHIIQQIILSRIKCNNIPPKQKKWDDACITYNSFHANTKHIIEEIQLKHHLKPILQTSESSNRNGQAK